MGTDLWWLWVVLAFLLIAFLIALLARRKDGASASMAHPAHEEEMAAPVLPDHDDGAQAQRLAPAPAAAVAAAADDLEVIEGIGPKIAALLRQAGITSFPQLAVAEMETIERILADAHLSHLTDPGTWSKQASLAAEGRWDELKAYQQTLKGGHAG